MTSQINSVPSESLPRPKGLARLLNTRLPLNRKEAFFTATVLPAIICADSFEHFHLFLSLLDLRDIPIDTSVDNANILFFTEYSLAEAIFGELTKSNFPNAPHTKERPDVIILIEGSEPLLIAIEAKLYSSTQAPLLNWQMDQQEVHLLSYLQRHLPGLRTIHAALLPDAMKREFGSLVPTTRPIITWEDILDKYKDVKSARYFLEILRIALGNYKKLKAKSTEAEAEGALSGEDILRGYQDGTLKFKTMGRNGGIHGEHLFQDIAKPRWQKQPYYVRTSPDPLTANWFRVSDFVDLLSRKKLITVLGRVVKSGRDSETDDAVFGHRVREILKEGGGVDELAVLCDAVSRPTDESASTHDLLKTPR